MNFETPPSRVKALASAPVPLLSEGSDEAARLRLRRNRIVATGLLVVMAVIFVSTRMVPEPGFTTLLIQSGAEAGMVGGVADWFAVTALFRHPLGLPIPHTALIVERKDQFGATLGQFVVENFLNADVLAERIRAAGLARRVAGWLSEPANAARFAGHAAEVVVTLAGTLRDEDVQSALTAEMSRAAAAIDVAPLAGRAVGVLIAGGHQ